MEVVAMADPPIRNIFYTYLFLFAFCGTSWWHRDTEGMSCLGRLVEPREFVVLQHATIVKGKILWRTVLGFSIQHCQSCWL